MIDGAVLRITQGYVQSERDAALIRLGCYVTVTRWMLDHGFTEDELLAVVRASDLLPEGLRL